MVDTGRQSHTEADRVIEKRERESGRQRERERQRQRETDREGDRERQREGYRHRTPKIERGVERDR